MRGSPVQCQCWQQCSLCSPTQFALIMSCLTLHSRYLWTNSSISLPRSLVIHGLCSPCWGPGPSWRAIRRWLASMEQQGETDFLVATTYCSIIQWLEIQNIFYSRGSQLWIDYKRIPSREYGFLIRTLELALTHMLLLNLHITKTRTRSS